MISEVTNNGTISDEIISRALDTYRHSSRATIEEKLAINRLKYADEHGSFSLRSDEEDDEVVCTLVCGGESYFCRIPKERESVTAKVYPIGDVTFNDVSLIAVSLRADFPWTDEAFVAVYNSTVDTDTVESDEDWFKDVKILRQYFAPRGVSEEPFDNIVLPDEESSEKQFEATDMRNFFNARKPNPWAFASLFVAYEDQEEAQDVFSSVSDQECYRLTPPEEVNSPSTDEENQ